VSDLHLPSTPADPSSPPPLLLASNRQELRFAPEALELSSRGRRGPRIHRIPYREITHVGRASSGLWIATRSGVEVLRRARFGDSDHPEQVARELVARIATQPGGTEQLERMAAVAALARRPRPRLATSLFAALCVAVYLLQRSDPFVTNVGAFVPELVVRGQWWRVVTANFLHGFPLHLLMNVLGALGFGLIVERVIGSVSTVIVLAAAALTAMAASALTGYQEVIGASGAVFGLIGAALHLELNHPERLPAFWRLPRRLFFAALAVEALIGWLLPFVAGAAHFGGFVGGFMASAWLAERGDLGRVWQRGPKLAFVAVGMVLLLSAGAMTRFVERDGPALRRLAVDLLSLPDVRPGRLNDLAWRMATESRPGPAELDAALALAERAVRETERTNPDLLDTLAEVLFIRGDTQSALIIIDEAISLTGSDTYFLEQRRRFTGERAFDDRPDPPRLPWFLRRPQQLWIRIPGSGLEI